MNEVTLRRPLLISLGVVLLLAAVAFWPSRPEPIAPRPTLKAPIAFDVLNPASLPQGVPDTGPAPAGSGPIGEK